MADKQQPRKIRDNDVPLQNLRQSDSDEDDVATPLSVQESVFFKQACLVFERTTTETVAQTALSKATRFLSEHAAGFSGHLYARMAQHLHATVLSPRGRTDWDVYHSRIYSIAEALVRSEHFDAKVARGHHFNRRFARAVVLAIRSDHPKERESAQKLMYFIYSRMKSLRSYIEKVTWQTIQTISHSKMPQSSALESAPRPAYQGLAELLQVVASWVEGFTPPSNLKLNASGSDKPDLRTSSVLQRQLLFRVLMPLHKVSHEDSHAECIDLDEKIESGEEHWVVTLQIILESFLDNDQSLAPAVLRYLLVHWPHLNIYKELLFLTKILRVLRRVCGGKNTPLFMRPMMDPCFRMVARCLTSPNHLVANRALSFLGIEAIFHNRVLDLQDKFGQHTRYCAQECNCVVIHDEPPLPISIAPREMTKLTSGRRRRSSSRRLSKAEIPNLRVGQAFTKTWHLQACGGAWPVGCQLVHTSGACFGTMGARLVATSEKYKTDTSLVFTVALVAPSEPGRFSAKWHMALPEGRWFGQALSLNVEVLHGDLQPSCKEASACVAEHWRCDRPTVVTRSLRSQMHRRRNDVTSSVSFKTDAVMEGILKRHHVLVNRIFFPALCLGERSFRASHPIRAFDRLVWCDGLQEAFAEAKRVLHCLLQNSRFREGRQLKKVELEKAAPKKPGILRSLSLVAGDRSGSFSGTIESADISPSEVDGSPLVKFKTRAPSDRLCLSGKDLIVWNDSIRTQSTAKESKIKRSTTSYSLGSKIPLPWRRKFRRTNSEFSRNVEPKKFEVLFSCPMHEHVIVRGYNCNSNKKWHHRALALTSKLIIAFPWKDMHDSTAIVEARSHKQEWSRQILDLEHVCVSAHNNTELALVFKHSVHEVHGVEVSELLLFLKIIFRESCSKLRGDFRTGLRVREVDDLDLYLQEFK